MFELPEPIPPDSSARRRRTSRWGLALLLSLLGHGLLIELASYLAARTQTPPAASTPRELQIELSTAPLQRAATESTQGPTPKVPEPPTRPMDPEWQQSSRPSEQGSVAETDRGGEAKASPEVAANPQAPEPTAVTPSTPRSAGEGPKPDSASLSLQLEVPAPAWDSGGLVSLSDAEMAGVGADPESAESRRHTQFNAVLARIEAQIMAHWRDRNKTGQRWPADLAGKIHFQLSIDGQLLASRQHWASASPEFDAAVMAALHAVERYDLPADPEIARWFQYLSFEYDSNESERERAPWESQTSQRLQIRR